MRRFKDYLLICFISALIILAAHPGGDYMGSHVHPSEGEISESPASARSDETDLSADVPTLLAGDSWEYVTELNITLRITMGDNEIELSGNLTEEMNLTVAEIATVSFNGTQALCYRLDILGEFRLEAAGYGGAVSASMDSTMDGAEYICVSDLSIASTHTVRNGTLGVNSPLGDDVSVFNISSSENYAGYLETYDFPLAGGEGWSQDYIVNETVSGDMGGVPLHENDVRAVKASYGCNVSAGVPAMGELFDTFAVDIDGGSRLDHYSPEVRGLVRREYNSGSYMKIPGLAIDITDGTSVLVSCDLGEPHTDILIDVQEAAAPDSVIEVSGTVQGTQANEVSILIPGLDLASGATLTDGGFKKELYIGNGTDDTPADDLGTHGIIVIPGPPGTYEALAVRTLTLAPPDVSVLRENVTFDPPGGGTVGTSIGMFIPLRNPSIVPVGDLDLTVRDEGYEFYRNSSIDMAPGGSSIIEVRWTPLEEGLHNITIIADPDGKMNESNEDDNRATLQYLVSEKPVPYFVNVTPFPGNVTMPEGQNMSFSAEGADPDGSQPLVQWQLDGVPVTPVGHAYTYSADFNSSGNHTLKVVLRDADEPLNSSMRREIAWLIKVGNVNRVCRAVISRPGAGYAVNAGVAVNFSANGSRDPDIDPSELPTRLNFTWELGDGSIAYGMNVSHVYRGAGRYLVRLNVTDPEGEWNLTELYLNVTEIDDDPGEIPDGPDDDNGTGDNDDPGDIRRPKGAVRFICPSLLVLALMIVVVIIVVRKRKRKMDPSGRELDGEVDEAPGDDSSSSDMDASLLGAVPKGEKLVECKGLEKSFRLPGGNDYPVLKGIDLTLRPGEFVTLMGPSGSGKSTLLNVIGAMIPGSGGIVRVNDRSLAEMNHKELTSVRRRDVGWIFQDFNLVDNLTALENVIIPMNLAGKVDEGAEERARGLLKLVDLEDRLGHFPDTLSGGQQQRVAIARALVNDPPLILADEPTGNLDSASGNEIIALFKRLAGHGKGILMVTHDIELARASDRVYVIRNGFLEESLDQEVGK